VRDIAASGVSVLMVEQNATAALKIADYAYVIEGGRLVLSGPAAELARDDRVRNAYLGGYESLTTTPVAEGGSEHDGGSEQDD
jgi:branched-chain amino acid transport system ATP-binding protein